MIKVDSKVKTREGLFGIVTDIIPHRSGRDYLDAIYLAGNNLPYFRWQLEELTEPVIIEQRPKSEVPEGDHYCMRCQGTPIKGADDHDWFVIVVMAHTGNIDWCNLNPVNGAVVADDKGYRGLGTLVECKTFVKNSKSGDKYYIFKLSEWRFTNL